MQDYKQIQMLLDEGYSYSAVAKQLGVSRQRIHQICEKENMSRTWKVKSPTSREYKLENFNLSEDFYQICSLRFTRKKQNCKSNGIAFDVEFSDIFWPTHCPVLGIELDYWGESGTRMENSPSFDKLDPSKGYIQGNVQIISWRANRIKNDGTAMEHRRIAEYIDKHAVKNIAL